MVWSHQAVSRILQAHFSSEPLRWVKTYQGSAMLEVRRTAVALILVVKTLEPQLSLEAIEMIMRAINFRLMLPPEAAEIEWQYNADPRQQ